MEQHREATPIPDAEGWSYGGFEDNRDERSRTVPLRRDDGKTAEFTVPDFVSDPEDLRDIALTVIGALEKWEQVKGLGA